MSEDKSNFTPPEQRKREHSLLDITEMEYLDRLVLKGEGLLHSDLLFSQAEALLRTGHAEVKRLYPVAGSEGMVLATLRLIVPTEKGKTLAAIRENEKLARLKADPPHLITITQNARLPGSGGRGTLKSPPSSEES